MIRTNSNHTSNRSSTSSPFASSDSEDILWTAARCDRLLHCITTRINDLRKVSETNIAKDEVLGTNDSGSGTTRGTLSSSQGLQPVAGQRLVESTNSDSDNGNDPVWLPYENDVNLQTYSNARRARRMRKRRNLAAVDQDPLDLFLSSAFKPLPLSDYQNFPWASSSGSSENEQRPRKKRKWPVEQATGRYQVADGLIDTFDTLLRNTQPARESPKLNDHVSRIGASSLVRTCLRKIPEWISIGNESEDSVNEGKGLSIDTTADTYHYLEEMFSVQTDGGWPGLRLVVKAQGVKLILDAVSDKVLPLKILHPLLDICKKYNAVVESQQLLRAWFHQSSKPISDRVAKLVDFCIDLDCKAFMFQFLRNLLRRGLFLDCDLRRHTDVWREMFHAMTERATRSDALTFFEGYALECIRTDCTPNALTRCQAERTKFLQGVTVIITTLGWTNYDGRQASDGVSTDLVQLANRMAFSAYQMRVRLSGDVQLYRERHVLHRMQSFQLFWTSSLVLHSLDLEGDSSLGFLGFETVVELLLTEEKFAPSLPHCHKSTANIPEFFCEMANCVAYAGKAAGQELLKDVVTGLLEASKTCSVTAANFLKKLAVNSAWAWTKHCGDNNSHAFAEDVENSAFCYTRSDGVLRTLGSPQKPTRYRWEDGLGEWIATTPLAGSTIRHPDTGRLVPADVLYSERQRMPGLRRRLLSTDGETRLQTKRSEDLEDDGRDELALDIPVSEQPTHSRRSKMLRIEALTSSHTTISSQTRSSRLSRPIRSASSESRNLDLSDDELGL